MLLFPRAVFQQHLCFQDAVKEPLITSSASNPPKAATWRFCACLTPQAQGQLGVL